MKGVCGVLLVVCGIILIPDASVSSPTYNGAVQYPENDNVYDRYLDVNPWLANYLYSLLSHTTYGEYIPTKDVIHFVDETPDDLTDGPENAVELSEGVGGLDVPEPRSRTKRQTLASNMALSHTNWRGNNRKVGRPFPVVSGGGSYNNRRNYNFGYTGGIGAVLARSKNGRHSLGAAVTGTGFTGRYGSNRFGSLRPSNLNYGLGYRFKFG